MRERLLRAARRAASSRRIPRSERAELTRELHGHLLDARDEFVSLGMSLKEAERRALRDFGDTRTVRADLRSAYRGRPVVLFPRTTGERLRRFAAHEGRVLVLIIAIVALLRWQVVAAYHIPSKSMEPTLHGDPSGGDKILVNKLSFYFSPPQRWQMAVFELEWEDRNLIKRIAGLPGEQIDLRNGDVYIDGKIARKPRWAQDDLLVPVYVNGALLCPGRGEERLAELDAWEPEGTWTASADGFTGVAEEGGMASLAFLGEVRDRYPGGSPRPDAEPVGDLVLSFKVRPGAETTLIGVGLREGGDAYEAHLPVGEPRPVTIVRNKAELVSGEPMALEPGRVHFLRFANLDDRVTIEVDGVEVLGTNIRAPDSESMVEPKVAQLGHAGGESLYSDVALLRDIHYRAEGRLPFDIPDDALFMLGDNSANSKDSRSWGAVPVGQLVGRPLLVFWPPRRIKLVH